jgi:hypothetical protein
MADGSIKTPIHPRLDVSPKVQEKIHDRLYAQHARIFQVISVIETLMGSIAAKDENGDDDQLTAYFGVLTLMHDTLTDIAEEIEPGSILSAEPSDRERTEAGANARRERNRPASEGGAGHV